MAATGSSATGSISTRRPPAWLTSTRSPGLSPMISRSRAGTTTWPLGEVLTIGIAILYGLTKSKFV